MKRKLLSLALVLTLCAGLVPAALAAGPTFTDVPENHWAYADVEAAAAAGVMNGTGGGLFSPDVKVSVSQFLTLVGRVVFPDTVVGENDTWYGPYVTACQSARLLTGTQVDTNNVEAEISRYDMAVILRAAAMQLGVTQKAAQSSEVGDYMNIPTRYADAVLAVYGMGLIKGDGAGNFNGSNTMARSEVATVIMRLKKATKTEHGQPTESPSPVDPTQPTTPVKENMINLDLTGWLKYGTNGNPDKNGIGVDGVPFELRYTEDNGATYTVLAEGTTEGKWRGIDSPGCFQMSMTVAESLYDSATHGNGSIYVSAEAVVNGQRYVTQDRRTDGHATIVPISSRNWNRFFVDLVPPDRGETMDIEIYARVEATTYIKHEDGPADLNYYVDEITNSKVKIYYVDQQGGSSPVLIAETNADGGTVNGVITIDTAYYNPSAPCYVFDIEVTMDGQLCTNRYEEQEPVSMYELTNRVRAPHWFLRSAEYLTRPKG